MRVNGDTAWVVGEESFRARLRSGKEVDQTLLATSVFERIGDGWRMVHHHVSVLPPRPSAGATCPALPAVVRWRHQRSGNPLDAVLERRA